MVVGRVAWLAEGGSSAGGWIRASNQAQESSPLTTSQRGGAPGVVLSVAPVLAPDAAPSGSFDGSQSGLDRLAWTPEASRRRSGVPSPPRTVRGVAVGLVTTSSSATLGVVITSTPAGRGGDTLSSTASTSVRPCAAARGASGGSTTRAVTTTASTHATTEVEEVVPSAWRRALRRGRRGPARSWAPPAPVVTSRQPRHATGPGGRPDPPGDSQRALGPGTIEPGDLGPGSSRRSL